MKKVASTDKQIALILAAQLEDFDSRNTVLDLDDHPDLLIIRRAFISLLKDWFCTPAQWEELAIVDI